MSSTERLLSPKCHCGKTMRLVAPRTMPQREETRVDVFHCTACGHEMRVTVWGADAA